ncbi:MAG: trypsin-like serine protease [Polyangiaceae bacterium]
MSAVYRSSTFWLALAAKLGVFATSGCADADSRHIEVEVAQLSQARQSIVDGETDATRRAVVAVGSFAGGGLSLCTGTLIAPNLILTARHCVTPTRQGTVQCDTDGFSVPLEPADIGVSPATNALADGRFYAVSQVHVPPSADEVCGGDIALLILDGAFPASSAEPIAPRLDEPVQSGEFYTAVGYGLNLDEGVGTRRAREGLEVTCGPLDCPGSDSFTKTEFVGDEGVCEGDSGGPALDMGGRVVGVVSRGTEECDLAVYSAVSSWRDWIREVGGVALDEGDYARPAWLDASAELASEAPTALGDSPNSTATEPDGDVSAPAAALAPASSAGGCSVTGAGASSAGFGWAAALFGAALFGAASRRRLARRRHQA